MMRDRAWRRYIEEKKVIRRLKRKCSDHWWRFEDANDILCHKRTVASYLGTKEYFWSKTLTATKWDSRYKCKYSPNKSSSYSRDKKKSRNSNKLREKDKLDFFKILKEYGLK